MKSKTILIAAGGTGGHLYPAIAIADEIRRTHPDVRVIFVGTGSRIESREVPRAGYPFYPIAIEAPGNSLKTLLLFPWKLTKAVFDCMRLISRERPVAMLGAGAYLSIPAGVAAWAYHVPIALIEINSVAGTANKLLAYLADKLFIVYPESCNEFPKRVAESATVSGTPVRGDLGLQRISQGEARNAFGLDPSRTTILVFGGSLGARAINEAMRAITGTLVANGYNVLWQTGKSADLEELQREFLNVPNVRVTDYIYEMEKAYHAADLVVCRAGASSLAELARLGKPAVLVPYPFAAADHQEKNAIAFEREGAAVVLRDKELKEKLESTILELIADTMRLQSMSDAMHRRDNPDAATIVAEWLTESIRN
jgi:UDP-N-acetylglucosamine--N-acetylmuramyl-(pentapeptide) pyrophosphoryl-undecaprenol N-acetylglucosamine transferase